MIMSPGILALMAVSVLLAVYSLYATGAGLHILAGWEPASSSQAQLMRERRTSLLSSILGFIMVADLLCVVLFVTLADRLHGLFTGAMCAAGTLNANTYGNPTLILMTTGFVFCILWLIVNHLDALAPNFALIRLKYLSLLPVTAVLGAQAYLLVNYFVRLDPTLLTSCCATFFDGDGPGLRSDLAHLSPALMEPLFWAALVGTSGVGLLSIGVGGWDKVYAGLSFVMLPLGLISVISFISVRIYELPTHHCPFCLLQPEYGCVGYLLYTGLLLGTSLGMGVGLVRWFGRRSAVRAIGFRMARRLKLWSLTGYALLGSVAVKPMLCSDFNL